MEKATTGRLELELLPAKYGDAILLTWGPSAGLHRLLIDGGPACAYAEVSARLKQVAAQGPLDLLVLTHIDADHIEGALLLTNDADLNIKIGEYWFNGPAQVAPDLGAKHGEMLAALISARGIPLNAAFDKQAVCVQDGQPPPTHPLPGGLTLTVLGPDSDALAGLKKAWLPTFKDERLVFASEKEALEALRARAGLNPATTFLSGQQKPLGVPDLLRAATTTDTAPANRSSIVLLAEYEGVKVLLPGDATPAALLSGVERLLTHRKEQRLDLSALKLPHHGSTRNVTKELLELLPADNYLFSSDGGRFGHPDDSGVAKCLAYGKAGSTMVFNYRNPRTLRWQDATALNPRMNQAQFPFPGSQGVTVSFPAAVQAG